MPAVSHKTRLDSGSIKLKLIRMRDEYEVVLVVRREATVSSIKNQFNAKAKMSANKQFLLYNGCILNDNKTPNSLRIKDNATLYVYTEEDSLNVKVVPCGDLSRAVNMSVKYGDLLYKLKKQYATRKNIGVNSVRFMYRGRALCNIPTFKDIGITPNRMIEVYPAYKEITIQFVKAAATSDKLRISAKYGNPLNEVLKEYAKLANREFNSLKFIYKSRRIRAEDTPAMFYMVENDVISVQEDKTINLKFTGPLFSTDEVGVSILYDEAMLKAMMDYAAKIGQNQEKMRFLLNGKRIRKDDTPEFLMKFHGLKDNSTIIAHHLLEYVNFSLKRMDTNSRELRMCEKYNIPMDRVKNTYAGRFREPVESLKFLFDGFRIMNEDTPRSLELEDNDVIEVYKDDM